MQIIAQRVPGSWAGNSKCPIPIWAETVSRHNQLINIWQNEDAIDLPHQRLECSSPSSTTEPFDNDDICLLEVLYCLSNELCEWIFFAKTMKHYKAEYDEPEIEARKSDSEKSKSIEWMREPVYTQHDTVSQSSRPVDQCDGALWCLVNCSPSSWTCWQSSYMAHWPVSWVTRLMRTRSFIRVWYGSWRSVSSLQHSSFIYIQISRHHKHMTMDSQWSVAAIKSQHTYFWYIFLADLLRTEGWISIMPVHKSGMLYLWISATHHQSVLSNIILKRFVLLQCFNFF